MTVLRRGCLLLGATVVTVTVGAAIRASGTWPSRAGDRIRRCFKAAASGGWLRIGWFFRGSESQRFDLHPFVRRESFAAFEFRDEPFVQGHQFVQPPGLFGDQLSVLHVKPFEQLVAHLVEPGVVSQGMQGFDRQSLAVRKDLGLNQTFAHVPGT